MPRTFCLLNHSLTQNQIAELSEKFNSSEVVYPDAKLAGLWSQIPPDKPNDSIVAAVISWLKNNATFGDVLFDFLFFSSYILSVVDMFSYRAFELKERDRNCVVSVSSIRVMHLPRAYLRLP